MQKLGARKTAQNRQQSLMNLWSKVYKSERLGEQEIKSSSSVEDTCGNQQYNPPFAHMQKYRRIRGCDQNRGNFQPVVWQTSTRLWRFDSSMVACCIPRLRDAELSTAVPSPRKVALSNSLFFLNITIGNFVATLGSGSPPTVISGHLLH